MSQSIDVTGLSPEAVRMLERVVQSLREQDQEGPGAGKDRWSAALEAAKGLTDYDFDAWKEQRAFDQQHGQDHLK